MRSRFCHRVPQEAPQAVVDIIAACLSLVPTQRPSAKVRLSTAALQQPVVNFATPPFPVHTLCRPPFPMSSLCMLRLAMQVLLKTVSVTQSAVRMRKDNKYLNICAGNCGGACGCGPAGGRGQTRQPGPKPRAQSPTGERTAERRGAGGRQAVAAATAARAAPVHGLGCERLSRLLMLHHRPRPSKTDDTVSIALVKVYERKGCIKQLLSVLCDSCPFLLLQEGAATPQTYELLRSLLRFAHAVYGGPAAAQRAGWQAPPVTGVIAAAGDAQLHRCDS